MPAAHHNLAIQISESARMTLHASDELEVLEREIKANLASPRADTVVFLNEALRSAAPHSIQCRSEAQSDLSDRHCIAVLSPRSKHFRRRIEPAALAVMLARDTDERALL